jgi:hypothetical protein
LYLGYPDMMTEPREVAGALIGTPLENLAVRHGPGGTILIEVEKAPSGETAAWRTAHELVPVTGRVPVLVEGGDYFDCTFRSERDPLAPTDDVLVEFDRAARTVDPWPDFPRYEDPEEDAEDWEEYGRLCASPGADAAKLEEAVTRLSDQSGGLSGPAVLVLLPASLPWLAPLWISYYGAYENEDTAFGAILWQWHQRCGARLRACWSDLALEFEVDSPPVQGEDAWEVSGQIDALAGDRKLPRWQTALALPQAPLWTIYDRP